MGTSKTILVIGAGGIGSWLVQFLDQAVRSNQINGSIIVADDDAVDFENTKFQNYQPEDVGKLKTEAMQARYGVLGLPNRIEDADMFDAVDLVISAVDNTALRTLVFKECKTPWIDLRCEGRQVAAFCSHEKNTTEEMLKTLPVEVESGSCQRAQDVANGKLQNGNKIIAAIGSQLVLNQLRGDSNPKQLILSV